MNNSFLASTNTVPSTPDLEACLAELTKPGPNAMRLKTTIGNWFAAMVESGAYQPGSVEVPPLRPDPNDRSAYYIMQMRTAELSTLIMNVHKETTTKSSTVQTVPTKVETASKAVEAPAPEPVTQVVTAPSRPPAPSAVSSAKASNDLADLLERYNADTESMLMTHAGFLKRLDRIETGVSRIESRQDSMDAQMSRISDILPNIARCLGNIESLLGFNSEDKTFSENNLNDLFEKAEAIEEHGTSQPQFHRSETSELVRELYVLAGLNCDVDPPEKVIHAALASNDLAIRMVQAISASDQDLTMKSIGNPAGIIVQVMSTHGAPVNLLR